MVDQRDRAELRGETPVSRYRLAQMRAVHAICDLHGVPEIIESEYEIEGNAIQCRVQALVDEKDRRIVDLEAAASRMLATWGSSDEDEIIAARDEVRRVLGQKGGE